MKIKKVDVKANINLPNVCSKFNVASNPDRIVFHLQKALSQLPEVEKVSGNINVKVKGHQQRFLTFKYK